MGGGGGGGGGVVTAHASTVRGAAGRLGAPAVTRVATRARRVGVEGYRGPALAAVLVVPAHPAKPRRATGSATTAAPRSPDTATARTSSGAGAVTNVSMENQVLNINIKTCPVGLSRTVVPCRVICAILYKRYRPNIGFIVCVIIIIITGCTRYKMRTFDQLMYPPNIHEIHIINSTLLWHCVCKRK